MGQQGTVADIWINSWFWIWFCNPLTHLMSSHCPGARLIGGKLKRAKENRGRRCRAQGPRLRGKADVLIYGPALGPPREEGTLSLAWSGLRPEKQSGPNLLTGFVGLTDEQSPQLESDGGWGKLQSPEASESLRQAAANTSSPPHAPSSWSQALLSPRYSDFTFQMGHHGSRGPSAGSRRPQGPPVIRKRERRATGRGHGPKLRASI